MVPFSGFAARGFPGQGESRIYQGGERRLGEHLPRLRRGLQSSLIYLVGRRLAGLLLWLQDVVLRSGNHSPGD